MPYSVTILDVAPRLIAASGARAQQGKIAATMLGRLDAAWAFIRASGVKSDGHNIAIYRQENGVPIVVAGAGVFEKFEGNGEISCVATPSGRAAMTVHVGPYAGLGGAHTAVREWCAANGSLLEGTNWEIYGHWDADPARLRTDVYYLLR